MGVLDCGAMVIRGHFDVFDRATGAIEDIAELLEKEEYPIEIHVSPVAEPHFYDKKEELLSELRRAVDMVNEACQIAQDVMAQI